MREARPSPTTQFAFSPCSAPGILLCERGDRGNNLGGSDPSLSCGWGAYGSGGGCERPCGRSGRNGDSLDQLDRKWRRREATGRTCPSSSARRLPIPILHERSGQQGVLRAQKTRIVELKLCVCLLWRTFVFEWQANPLEKERWTAVARDFPPELNTCVDLSCQNLKGYKEVDQDAST